jgi:D-glycero-D-manno-heptose 1,7-bisphosphate phosphatase
MKMTTLKAVAQVPTEVKPALCLDLDGTIRTSASGAKFIEGPGDVALFDDVEEKIWQYRNDDWLVFGISNQGGVAFGYKSHTDAMAEVFATIELFNENPFHLIQTCYYHEGGSVEPFCYRSLLRKPDIGMLARCEIESYSAGYLVDWDNSLFVGDRPEDEECARRAGIEFQPAWQFFGRPVPMGLASGDAEAIGHPDSGGGR